MKSVSPQAETASALAANVRIVLSMLKRQLREHGKRQDLRPSQVSVLIRLDQEGPATVSGLARAEGMRPQSMSSIIASLQDAGLVTGIPDPQDGRKTLMLISKKCEKWLREGRAAKQDWLTTVIVQRFSPREQQQLSKALKLLSRLTETDSIS